MVFLFVPKRNATAADISVNMGLAGCVCAAQRVRIELRTLNHGLESVNERELSMLAGTPFDRETLMCIFITANKKKNIAIWFLASEVLFMLYFRRENVVF